MSNINLREYNKISDFERLFKDGRVKVGNEFVNEILSNKKYLFKRGNGLLQNSENIKFLIFDLPRVITCIKGRTNYCTENCFQKKVETRYKGEALIRRKEDLIKTLHEDFVDLASKTIIRKVKRNAGKTIIVRIHGDGDFYSIDYLFKWIEIACITRNKLGNEEREKVIFVAYTKAIEYISQIFDNNIYRKRFLEICRGNLDRNKYDECEKQVMEHDEEKNDIIKELLNKYIPIKFLSSIMDDTESENIKLSNRLGLYKYKATTKEIKDKERESDEIFCDITNTKCKEGSCLQCYPPSKDIVTKLR